jgi:hypothetical protein
MTEEERDGLRKIRRWRFRLWFFVLSYVPVVWIVRRAIASELALASIVLAWTVAVVRYAGRTANSKCPRCGNLFHSTPGASSWFNLLTRKCIQCGLSLKTDRVIYPSMES